MSNVFDALFAGDPDRTLLILPDGQTLTYYQVAERARTMGAALVANGLKPGDRVISQTDKSPESYALWLGALATGIVFVPTNTAYTSDELTYFYTDADASLLVVDDPATVADAAQANSLQVASLTELAALAKGLDPAPVEPVGSDAVATLIYTSGTTGRPKGAAVTHANLADNGEALAQVWEISADDTIVHALPIFHVHGLFIALHPLMLRGAAVILLPKFDPDTVVANLGRATVFMGVPTFYQRLLGHDGFTAELCAGLRLFTSGSAPMTEATHAEFTARTGREIVERYGMTEAGIITSNRLGNIGVGSVGHALPGYEIRVVDESGDPVDSGTAGIVEIRGQSVCAGYWGRPDADSEVRRDGGWFSTGDVGVVDETGRLTLEGRSSDMIISGGLNIYPKEIEVALDATPGVVESAVVGLADRDFGEAVTAVLVLEPGQSLDSVALDQALAPLARFKHPKAVHLVNALPRNALGKVQKSVLRQQLS